MWLTALRARRTLLGQYLSRGAPPPFPAEPAYLSLSAAVSDAETASLPSVVAVRLRLQLDSTSNMLRLHVIEARGLPRSQAHSLANPYVKW